MHPSLKKLPCCPQIFERSKMAFSIICPSSQQLLISQFNLLQTKRQSIKITNPDPCAKTTTTTKWGIYFSCALWNALSCWVKLLQMMSMIAEMKMIIQEVYSHRCCYCCSWWFKWEFNLTDSLNYLSGFFRN